MRAAIPGAVVCLFALACTPTTRRLDEAAIYQGPQFQLKVVRYFEDYPLHYKGEVFTIQCSSSRTKQSSATKTQDAGWVSVGNGGAIGSKSASELAERERHKYTIVDEQTLVWIGNGFNVSFDACGQFRSWYPTSLPDELIDAMEKPEWCRPRGTADCRHYDFLGDGEPRFDQIRVMRPDSVSFVVRSKAFRNQQVLSVRSEDSGRTWTVTPL